MSRRRERERSARAHTAPATVVGIHHSLEAQARRIREARNARPEMARWARDHGVYLTVSPDAHHVAATGVFEDGRTHRLDWWPEKGLLVLDSKFKRAVFEAEWEGVVRTVGEACMRVSERAYP